jgi:hypothetical protein
VRRPLVVPKAVSTAATVCHGCNCTTCMPRPPAYTCGPMIYVIECSTHNDRTTMAMTRPTATVVAAPRVPGGNGYGYTNTAKAAGVPSPPHPRGTHGGVDGGCTMPSVYLPRVHASTTPQYADCPLMCVLGAQPFYPGQIRRSHINLRTVAKNKVAAEKNAIRRSHNDLRIWAA